MGAPKGNQNAAKDNRAWGDMVRRKVAQNPEKLEQAALSVLNAAASGEPWAVTELRNTLDGKPIQPMEHKVQTESPSLTDAYLAHVAAGGKPDEWKGRTEH